MTLILILAFAALMVLAIPVGHALIIAAGAAILWDGGVPLMIVAQQMFQQTQSFPMLALPFFMLAGALMTGGRLGRKLLEFASEGMKRWRGGELSTTVVASVAFGGVSGSAVANASALGSVLIPWQKTRGYPAGLCAANNATSSVIDILIPPSIPLILYALVSGTSVADLFIAGILPGLLMAAGFVATCWWIAKRRGYTASDAPANRRALLRLAIKSSPAIALPILILVGLRFGFVTPTEMAVLSVVYSLLLSLFLYRDLNWECFRRSMINGRRHAGDHGQRGGRLAAHLRPGADALRRMGDRDHPQSLSGDPGAQHLDADHRHAARFAAGDPAAGADLRATRRQHRPRPGAARPDHGHQSRHRPLHAADRHDAVHLSVHRQVFARRHDPGALAVLCRGPAGPSGRELHPSA
jgi:hypothetical protein